MYQKAANKLGISEKRLRSAMYVVDKILAHRRRPDLRFILREETRLTNASHSVIKKQRDYYLQEFSRLEYFRTNKSIKVVTKGLENDINEIIKNTPFKRELVNVLTFHAGVSMLKGAARPMRLHKLARFGISFDLKNPEAVNYLKTIQTLHLSNFKGSISRTTEDGIRSLVIDSINKGESYTELAKKISASNNKLFGGSRARVIAVDQISNAYGEGSRIVMDDFIQRTGAQVSKLWVTAGDDKVTPGCRENADAGFIPFNAPFPSGHQREPRHINCLHPNTLVSSCGGISAISKRQYEGDMVTISTNNKSITITPNHPILTNIGWKAAKDINIGDNIVVVKSKPSIFHNNQNTESFIEDMFDSHRVSPVVVPLSSPDFHGDSPNGNVDIIFTNSFFKDYIFKFFVKVFIKFNRFTGSKCCSALFSFCSFYKRFLRMLHAFCSFMSILCLPFSLIYRHFTPLQFFRFRLSSQSYTVIDQLLVYGTPAESISIAQFIYGNSSFVEINNVNNISISHYSGSVYNMHTESGYYLSNSIVTHNCRCVVSSRIDSV